MITGVHDFENCPDMPRSMFVKIQMDDTMDFIILNGETNTYAHTIKCCPYCGLTMDQILMDGGYVE